MANMPSLSSNHCLVKNTRCRRDWRIGFPNKTHDEVIRTERWINWSKSIFLSVFHIGALVSLFFWRRWGIRVLELLGLAREIKRGRFNAAATVWQLASGEGK